MRIFEDRYKELAGNLLEGIARLFTQNVRLIVYPTVWPAYQNVWRAAKPDDIAWFVTTLTRLGLIRLVRYTSTEPLTDHLTMRRTR